MVIMYVHCHSYIRLHGSIDYNQYFVVGTIPSGFMMFYEMF